MSRPQTTGEPPRREKAEAYDGMELFDEEIAQQNQTRTFDSVDVVIMDAGKTYGDQDGRHKRP